MHYIYIHLHPVWLTPVYVGVTNDPRRRNHDEHTEDESKYRWGMFPHVLIVGAYRDREQCEHHENVWIDTLIRLGFKLGNKSKTKPDTPILWFWWVIPLIRLWARGL